MSAQGGDKLYAERIGIGGTITVEDVKQYVEANLQQGYSIFPIWAEESGALSNNNTQWSFGNGATGAIDIIVPEMEVYAMSFDAEVFGTSVSIELMRDNTAVESVLFTGASGYAELTTPISFTEGQELGFRTDVETGAYTDARVCAWCRIPLMGLKGETGAAGTDGVSGVPSQAMRVPLVGQSDVNGTNVVLQLGSPTINSTAGTVVGNDINLPIGLYKVTLDVSLNSTVQRSNIGFRFMKDGILYSQKSGSNYIRSTGGHNEAGDSITDLIEYTAAGTLSFESFLQGAAGVVNLESTSRVLIQKLS